MYYKSFKFRMYPNKEQCEKLNLYFGQSRFVYNYYKNKKDVLYREEGKNLSFAECSKDLTQLKKKEEFSWLKEASAQVLQQSLKNLEDAYLNFFRRVKKKEKVGYPKFKSKKDKQSIRFVQNIFVEDNLIHLSKLGWIKTVFHRELEGKMKSCTVSKTKSGKYFVSILCEMEDEVKDPADESVGIDLGLKDFATLSNGEKFESPKYLRKSERRLKIRQKRLSRKQKGSQNRENARKRLALQYEKVTNQRKDFHHKLSRYLVNNFGYIAFEDLSISGMVKNHKLAKSISDAGWAQFVSFCQYKLDWCGGVLKKIDMFFPSSKMCNCCGYINQDLKLSDRYWTCESCNTYHDRDINAAINILKHSTISTMGRYA